MHGYRATPQNSGPVTDGALVWSLHGPIRSWPRMWQCNPRRLDTHASGRPRAAIDDEAGTIHVTGVVRG
jgi:hypothetical protein